MEDVISDLGRNGEDFNGFFLATGGGLRKRQRDSVKAIEMHTIHLCAAQEKFSLLLTRT